MPLLLHDIDPSPVPVPLHGDLWPGNVAGGTIYDPAGYYGHGEADLGMTKMFGGECGSSIGRIGRRACAWTSCAWSWA